MIRGKLNFVVGGQYGSEGKGKIAGYLARKYNVDVSICSFSSQAGHTFVDVNGKCVVQQVPMAAVNPNTLLLISQGAIIDLDILRREIEFFGLNNRRLKIHPKAMVIQQEHKDYECSMADGPRHIASTCKGNGAAMADYVLRKKGLKTIADYEEFQPYLDDTTKRLSEYLDRNAMVMCEAAQGFSLDIYHGFYPYTTSRGCTPAAEMARIGIPPGLCGDVYGCYRTYPIRVGHIEDDKTGELLGCSGGHYPDQHEVDWDTVTKNSGADEQLCERTTVTNRIRRVFTFSKQQLQKSIDVMGVNRVCLTFADYINSDDYGVNIYEDLSIECKNWIKENMISMSKPMLIGTGPKNHQLVDVSIVDKRR